MLALLQHKSMPFCLILFMLTFLSACSRDNPLSVPEPFVEDEVAFCIEDSPYIPILLDSLDISNLTEVLPSGYPAEFIGQSISVNTPYLIDSLTIKPTLKNDLAFSVTLNEEDGQEEVLVVLNSVLDPELEDNLPASDRSLLMNFLPEINSLKASIDYIEDASETTKAFDEDLVQATVPLITGLNYVTIKVNSSIKVPRTSIDCNNPITDEEIASDEFENSDAYRTVQVNQEFPIIIERNDIDQFNQTELQSFIDLSSLDQFGDVIAISDNFLVLGLPNEDTEASGAFRSPDFIPPANDPLQAPLIEINEDAENSGAVLIYERVNNSWEFHSFLKSSNSDENDYFGTSVAIYENTLAVSAPGESSNASGLFQSASPDVASLKINNLAPSSGAVYLYTFDQQANSWSETHYIKPQNNVISDGNFDIAFGHLVQINDSLLLISAPEENSEVGDSSRSDQPESGAVFAYAFDSSNSSWRFLNTLKAQNPQAGDKFGTSVSVSDDLIAISAPFEDSDLNRVFNSVLEPTPDAIDLNNSIDSGAVYVFTYSINESTSQIQFMSMMKPTNNDPFDYFGSSLAVKDSFLFVGATGEDSKGKGLNREIGNNDLENSGAVYGYSLNRQNSVWSEFVYLKANDSQEEAFFGENLVYSRNSLFVSAPRYTSANFSKTGKLYLYHLESDAVSQNLSFQEQGSENNVRFGNGLAINDGYLAVGASLANKTTNNGEINQAGQLFSYE